MLKYVYVYDREKTRERRTKGEERNNTDLYDKKHGKKRKKEKGASLYTYGTCVLLSNIQYELARVFLSVLYVVSKKQKLRKE